jgi:hypothetical protein
MVLMLSGKSIEPKKFFVFVAIIFLLFTGTYAYMVLSHHYACRQVSKANCSQKGMCTATDGATVPCSFLNPDGSYKQKEVG